MNAPDGFQKIDGCKGVGEVAFAFFAVGAVFFFVFCLGLAGRPELWLQSERSPAAAAVLHAAVLGWLISWSYGLLYGSLHRLGRGQDASRRPAQVHFFLHSVALCLMLPGFARWDMGLVAHAGAMMALGGGICIFHVVASLEKGRRLPMVQISLTASLVWLVLTLVMGTLAASGHHWDILPMSTVTAIHAGMHAGFGGYLVLLLTGLAYVVFFENSGDEGSGRLWTFLLGNTGLFLCVWAIAFGLPLVVPVGALMVLAGLLFFFAEAFGYWGRKDVRMDAWDAALASGYASMVLLMGLGLASGLARTRDPAQAALWENVYGWGWITLATGLPLAALAGRHAALRSNASGTCRLALVLYLTGSLLGCWAMLDEDPALLRTSGLLLAAGGLCAGWVLCSAWRQGWNAPSFCKSSTR